MYLYGVDGRTTIVNCNEEKEDSKPQFEEMVVDGCAIYAKHDDNADPEAEERYYNEAMAELDSLIAELDDF